MKNNEKRACWLKFWWSNEMGIMQFAWRNTADPGRILKAIRCQNTAVCNTRQAFTTSRFKQLTHLPQLHQLRSTTKYFFLWFFNSTWGQFEQIQSFYCSVGIKISWPERLQHLIEGKNFSWSAFLSKLISCISLKVLDTIRTCYPIKRFL